METDNMSKFGIIFDMDGTLWDSAEGVAKSWTEVVQRLHDKERVITTEDIHSIMGLTMDRIADILFPELPKDERMKLLDACGNDENEYLRQHGGILYPQLEETLIELKKKYPLYIVSNCQSGYIEAFLEYYDFGKYFDDIECYGNNELGKGDNIRLVADRNHLDDAVYVGDIMGDYVSSKEAGVRFIHAAYGFGEIDDEVITISEFAELPRVMSELEM
jgi:phosphoglycolate phosphatase